MSEDWDGTFTPAQAAFDRQVRANDAALFAALDGRPCQECGYPHTQPAGACSLCPECGTSSGCS